MAAAQASGAGSNRLLGLLDRAVEFASRIGVTLAVLCIGAIIIIATADSVIGYFDRPFLGAIEIIQALLPPSVFLALGWVQLHRQHIVVDLFTSRMPPSFARPVAVFALLATAAVFALIGWLGWKQAIDSFRIGEVSVGYLRLPVWLPKFGLAVGATLVPLECVRQTIYVFLGRDDAARVEPAHEGASMGGL